MSCGETNDEDAAGVAAAAADAGVDVAVDDDDGGNFGSRLHPNRANVAGRWTMTRRPPYRRLGPFPFEILSPWCRKFLQNESTIDG